MLTLLAYARYVCGPAWKRMAVVAACFAFGLMSKPMLVTTPIVLLLLDYWPFDRFKKQGLWKLILEKVPLIILSVGSCAATLIAQQVAIGSTESLPPAWRINNALVSYVNYLRQMFWPVDLVPFYIHPEWRLATWEIIGAIILIAGITAAMFLWRRKLPYLLVGWLWYLVMLLPVIGIVQVGLQGHADRYTYLPHIGLYVALTWLIADVFSSVRYRRAVLVAAGITALVALSDCAWNQTSYWRNSEALWTRALAVTNDNETAHTNFGMLLSREGQVDEAISHFQ